MKEKPPANPTGWPAPTGGIMPRSMLVQLLRTALAVGEAGYARRLAASWLAAYPGDLQASLLHAQAILRENAMHGRDHSGVLKAIRILDGICQADPEYLEAYEWLQRARKSISGMDLGNAESNLVALGGLADSKSAASNWGSLLRQARHAIAQPGTQALAHQVNAGPVNTGLSGRPNELAKGAEEPEPNPDSPAEQILDIAEQLVHRVLLENPTPVLAGITHLEVSSRRGLPAPAMCSLAELYHSRWPNCLQFTLFLADSLMDGGEADRAVALLHEAASQDITGQVPARLWGQGHPYRSLWPDPLEAKLDIPIPASVAAALGWNRLPAGSAAAVSQPGEKEKTHPRGAEQAKAGQASQAKTDGAPTPALASVPAPTPAPEVRSPEHHHRSLGDSEALQSVEAEFTRVAGSLKKPQLARTDGRFPIYVILSSRQGLEAQYGPESTAIIEATLNRLADAVRLRKNWGSLVYFADEGYKTSTKRSKTVFHVSPARPDAWSLKLALADLDSVLGKRGEMIGALLIVGGPEIIPFHHLPNPIDDSDVEVQSDNPYSTRDENYFIPEWPVGRIPGGCGKDPQPLIESLQAASQRHREADKQKAWFRRLWERITELFKHGGGWRRTSLGYTAAVWKRASATVFRPVGDARDMLVCPPVQACPHEAGLSGSSEASCAVLHSSRFGYFNLHGLPDAVEWYGQYDPSEPHEGSDYPVALRPQDLAYANGNRPPQVVFSEACYGAHITGRTVDQAMALKFLSSGSQAVVGSTCTAYGAVTTPLTAADLLGYAFWSHLKNGIAAGESLRRAKIYLAKEMHRRQGYLDGEDQKTLISFVLYGDPLAQVTGAFSRSKTILRPLKSPGPIQAVCDRSDETLSPQPVPPQMMSYVKHVVSQYLPGMADADISLTQEHADCKSTTHQCPTSQMGAKSSPVHKPNRQVVTLSKQVQQSTFVHRHYARLTLDAQGKLVKLVVSR